MSTSNKALTEVIGAVNGFDELAVDKHFGIDLYVDENKDHPMRHLRACIFISLRHDGETDVEAYKAAMNLSTKEVGDYFAPEPEEVDDNDPETDTGKES